MDQTVQQIENETTRTVDQALDQGTGDQGSGNPAPAARPQGDAAPNISQEQLRLEGTLRNGASWFYWIAGLSVVNTAIILSGGQWSFIVGLGITQVIDSVAHHVTLEAEAGTVLVAKVMAGGFDLLVAGMFVLFGWLACQRKAWAFVVGMVLYALDGMLFLLVSDFLSLGFHGFALFCIFAGFQALRKLEATRPTAA